MSNAVNDPKNMLKIFHQISILDKNIDWSTLKNKWVPLYIFLLVL